jgi:flavin-dependent dehydrogenase
MSGSLVSTDVLVIGGGLAGERAAIEAAAAGHKVLILSLVPPRRSHSCAAQGGMQASLGNCVKADGDNATLHFRPGSCTHIRRGSTDRRTRTGALRRALDAGTGWQEQLFHQG